MERKKIEDVFSQISSRLWKRPNLLSPTPLELPIVSVWTSYYIFIYLNNNKKNLKYSKMVENEDKNVK